MGEPNAALNVYMSKKERIRDICEYYMGERIPPDYEISTEDGFYEVRSGSTEEDGEREEFILKENGEERVNMCRAIYEIKRDARREGKREGRCEAILELLEDCGEIPEETKERILKEKNTKRLGMWLKLAAKSESIEEFRIAM